MSSIDNVTNNLTSVSGMRLADVPRRPVTDLDAAAGGKNQARTEVTQALSGVRVSSQAEGASQVSRDEAVRAKAIDADELNEALAEIQDKLRPDPRSLQFTVNETLNDVVVRVVDPANDQVIREIPPEAIINLRERLRELNVQDIAASDLFPAGALLSDQS